MSIINKDYTISDFEGIGCANYININENVDNQFDELNKVLSLYYNLNLKLKVLETINLLMDRNKILYVSPDFEIKINSISYNDTFKILQWATDDIELPTSCKTTTGSSDILVGVFDSGIDSSCSEFQGKINTSLSRDFLTNPESIVNNINDVGGHVTHDAGINRDNTNNIARIASLNWDITLVSLRVFDEFDRGSISGFGETAVVT